MPLKGRWMNLVTMVVLRKYIQGRLRLAFFHIHEEKESGWNRKGRNGYNQKHTYYWQSEHSVFASPRDGVP